MSFHRLAHEHGVVYVVSNGGWLTDHDSFVLKLAFHNLDGYPVALSR